MATIKTPESQTPAARSRAFEGKETWTPEARSRAMAPTDATTPEGRKRALEGDVPRTVPSFERRRERA